MHDGIFVLATDNNESNVLEIGAVSEVKDKS